MSGLIRKYIAGEGWQTVVDDGGGSDFNGGTITETLVVANPNVAEPAITLQAAPDSAAQANSLIRILDEDGFERWDVDAGGHQELRVGDGHLTLDAAGWLHIVSDVPAMIGPSVNEIVLVTGHISISETHNLFSIARPGADDHSVRIGSGDVTDASLQLLGITDQTAPLLDVRDFDFNQVFAIGPTGAVTISPSDPDFDHGITFVSPDPSVASGQGYVLWAGETFDGEDRAASLDMYGNLALGPSGGANPSLAGSLTLTDPDGEYFLTANAANHTFTVVGAVTISPSDAAVAALTLTTGGLIFPSADPEVAGAWWDNAGTLTRSAG